LQSFIGIEKQRNSMWNQRSCDVLCRYVQEQYLGMLRTDIDSDEENSSLRPGMPQYRGQRMRPALTKRHDCMCAFCQALRMAMHRLIPYGTTSEGLETRPQRVSTVDVTPFTVRNQHKNPNEPIPVLRSPCIAWVVGRESLQQPFCGLLLHPNRRLRHS
jgi:hypothetical protein